LTYPAEFPTARASKRDLDAFRKRLEREYPGVCGVWKIEPQKRGAPHYHMQLFFDGVDYTQVVGGREGWRECFQSWMASAWVEICYTGDDRHFQFHRWGKRVVEEVKSYRQFMGYLGKYVGKPVENPGEWEAPGRYRGVVNRDAFRQLTRPRIWILNSAAWVKVRRVFRKLAPKSIQRRKAVRSGGTWWTWLKGDARLESESVLARLLTWAGVDPLGEAIPGGSGFL